MVNVWKCGHRQTEGYKKTNKDNEVESKDSMLVEDAMKVNEFKLSKWCLDKGTTGHMRMYLQ